MKILYAASECAPFVKAGGLGDVAQAYPRALASKGHEVCVVLPFYKSMKEKYETSFEFVASFGVTLSWRSLYCGVFRFREDGVTYYFIDNEYYFYRDSVYGDYDDGERFAFFCKAILEMLPHIGFFPDILHTNDWQCSMVPLFYKGFYQNLPGYGQIKHMFTIHNIEYQGKVAYNFLDNVLGMDDYYMRFLNFGGCVNLMFSAIALSDKVTTVSETYAHETQTAYFGHGLNEVLSGVSYKYCGITNGLSQEVYNPRTDPALYHKFGTGAMAGKKIGKRRLQAALGLGDEPDVPILSMVTRLVSHKGLDLVECVLDDIMQRRLQLIVLGTGESRYEKLMQDAAGRYPGRVSANIRFDSGLANRIYAASDLFLMPSKSEPCGLSQLIAMRYGAIPVVRETGGLKDTVWPINPETGEGRGITFQSYNAHDMLNAIDRGLDLYYNNRPLLKSIMYRNMDTDFGWDRSADRYIAIYESM